jgi:acyl carrier protein
MTSKTEWINFKRRICDYLDLIANDTRPYTTFVDLGLDSLDVVELVMFVEEEYDVDLPKEVDDIKSLAGLHGLLFRTREIQRREGVTHRDTEHVRSSVISKARNLPYQQKADSHCPTCKRSYS